MKRGNKAAIVCCSNGQPYTNKAKFGQLKDTLRQVGLVPIFSDFIYENNSVFSGSGKERAESLMNFYRDDDIKAIFDISGGDIANEILPYLDFNLIAQSDKMFWGYSDLTTVINAIYAKTGKKSALYQIRNLVSNHAQKQISDFTNTIFQGTNDLFSFDYRVIQKGKLNGIVIGGNIRCLLKLAGTEYWPDMNGKILLLESMGGKVPQMVTYLNQLKQIGVFDRINGIILGTFTQMEKECCSPTIIELMKQYAGEACPIIKTDQIGHGTDSKGIIIGEEMSWN